MPCVEKNYMVKELTQQLRGVSTIYTAGFFGLGVSDVDELRRNLKGVECRYLVVKNSMAARALEDAGLKKIVGFIDGPTALVLTNGDPLKALRMVVDFSKKHEGLQVRGGMIEGDILTDKQVEKLASLSSKGELVGKLVSMLNCPLTVFVGTLDGILQKFVGTLEAVRKHKEDK